MTLRYTLEGDNGLDLPQDAILLRVKGKYVPIEDLGNGILNGDYYVEEVDFHSPERAQLSGEEAAIIPVRFGTFYHDDALPIALSGDELGMFHLAALFKGFKFPSVGRMPAVRGLRLNTGGLSKSFKGATKSIQGAGKNILKTGQKAVKDYGNTLKKGFKDAGKLVGKVGEVLPDVLQAVGNQGGGAPEENSEDQEQPPEEMPGNESEEFSEEPISEDSGSVITDTGFQDEMSGELGFIQAAMAAAPMISNIVSSVQSNQRKRTQAKNQMQMSKLSALTNLKQSSVKKATSTQTKSFSNPALSQTSEGKYALTYKTSSRGGDAPNPNPPTPDKKDDKTMLYVGAGVVVLALAFFAFNNSKKGKR
ncbi:hypothetical protein [Leptospira stimsonii]|uniref:Uncharacterized protein n=1 Tax=Leptospira stimsonii TaxID=2202203 RepID=A0ABY2MV30_9LEPT|nr:hypothetical protein [Leptospira stimsonii]TGK25386.1 hypothetical protein EHO98_03020 [Leptospira stimsonii]TGM08805.1 hypothetical protein EHQ90_22205 [Leptospira stimsonii]